MQPLVAPVRSWPSPWQEQLLDAALGPDDGVTAAWEGMLGGRSLALIHDPAAQRILPIVAERLQRVDPGHRDLPALRSIRRGAWVTNMAVLDRCAPYVTALEDAGFEPLILKGLPLAAAYYRDMSLRPMADLDVLVPDDRFDAGLDLLVSMGLQSAHGAAQTRTHNHGAGLLDSDGNASLDLHFTLDRWLDTGAAVWSTSTRFTLPNSDVSFAAPDPTVMFAHCCIHGVRTMATVNLRWICDAAKILEFHADDIDWGRVAAMCSGPGVLLVREACGYLAGRFDLPIPQQAFSVLEARPVTVADRLIHKVAVGRDPAERTGKLMVTASTWARSRTGDGFWRSLRELPRFLVYHWDLESARQIPGFIAKRVTRRLGRREDP